MGDNFSQISNSTIINRSNLENAFNKIKENHGEATAQALKLMEKIIGASGNKEAVEVLNEFNSEASKPEPKKTVLKSFWSSLCSILPAISTTAGIAEHIVKLFQ